MTNARDHRSVEPQPIFVVGNTYPPHTLGGSELLCRDHVRWLRERGHPVTVLTSTYGVVDDEPAEETGSSGERVVRALDFHWKDFELHRPSGFALVAGERRQRRLLERSIARDRPFAIEVWHMAALSKSLLAVLAQRRLPSIAVVQENWPTWDVSTDAWLRLMRHGRLRDRVLTPPIRRLVGRAIAPPDLDGAFDRIRPAYCSDFLRRDVEEQFAPWRGRGVTVHNGIDLSVMSRPRPQDEPFRTPLRLLYCGRVEERKGVVTVVEALGELRTRGVPARLDIVGWRDERYTNELRDIAVRRSVTDAIRFLEPLPREELPDLYRANDVLVFPTLWDEPFGLVPLEAMATGCVVIGTGTGGSAEFMIDGRSALLHARGDASGLADRIGAAVSDPALVARLRRGGREVAAEHNIERFHEALFELLRTEARYDP